MDKEYLVSADSPTRTQAVRCGPHVLVSGLLPIDEEGNVVGTEITIQARYLFRLLADVLAKAGATLADVVKHNIFYDFDNRVTTAQRVLADLNSVRCEFFACPGPTATDLQAGLDFPGAHLLLDAWAVIGVEREPIVLTDHWRYSDSIPFSHGWRVGDMIFAGGQRALDQDGQLVGPGDIEAQTDRSFANMDKLLVAAGGDRNCILRQNTYYQFLGEGHEITELWERMTKVRTKYWAVPTPAGAGLRVAGFPDEEEMVQVEVIGILDRPKERLQPADHWDWSITGNQFTQGWKCGDFAFIGGQISADRSAKAVGDDIETQTRNVFQFIRVVLREAGLDESDVIKLFIYYCVPEDWEQVSEDRATIAQVQSEFYPLPGPATTSVRVAGFAFENLSIEIEAIALVRV